MKVKPKTTGPLSREDEIAIIKLLPIHNDETIAEMFNRTVDKIKNIRETADTKLQQYEYEAVITNLHLKFFWTETVAQLLPEEIVYFEKYWSSLITQFSNSGIVATDELMIRDLIILDILLNRCNKSRRACAEELQTIESDIIKIMADTKDDPIKRVTSLTPLQDRANALRTASKSLNEESKNIQEKKDKKYEQLKATRELRLEKVEKAGQDFYQLVKYLDTPEVRVLEGRLNSLYQVATELARLEYQNLHKYGNDTYDNPILTPEQQENEKGNNNGN